MSLIHEALKKAEEQRRLGEPPSLGSPLARTRERRSVLPFLIVAIALAAGAGWWVTRSGAPAPKSADAPPAASKAAPPKNATPPSTALAAGNNPSSSAKGEPLEHEAARSTATEHTPIPNLPPPAALPPVNLGSMPVSERLPRQKGSLNRDPGERERRGMPPGAPIPGSEAKVVAADGAPANPAIQAQADALRNRQQAKRDAAMKTASATQVEKVPVPDTKPTTAAANPNAVTTVVASGEGKPKADAAPSVPQVIASGEGKVKPEAPAPATSPSVVASGEGAPKSTPGAETPKADNTPMFWELPYNVRKDLPAFNVTMHVFSADPAKRFVVINGDRKAEGETLGTDINVREIRINGIVLEIKGQRFLVPRGGS